MSHSRPKINISPGLSRRRVLQIGGYGFLGLHAGLWPLPAAARPNLPAARARSVIFLFQFGGPSQIDLFDLKPDAPAEIRGPYRPIATRVPGLQISEKLPRLATLMQHVTLVRSVHHELVNHNPATYYALTGHPAPTDDQRLRDSLDRAPAYGSVAQHMLPPQPGLPGFVALPYVMRDGEIAPGQNGGYLGRLADPLLVQSDPNCRTFALPELSLPEYLTPERIEQRRAMQRLLDRQLALASHVADARALDDSFASALSLLESNRVRQAFDLASEPAANRERYGRTTYGQSCLLARRLVEAGVPFVNVYYAPHIGGQNATGGGWDTHGFNNSRMFPIIEQLHLPQTEATLPTLLEDLHERGLLDTTLVVWMGEFGRTPRINAAASRDHWPRCYSVLLAGGGVRAGYVHGASDQHAAQPTRDGVRPEDLSATLFHLLGLDPATELRDANGRPLPLSSGRVLHDLLA